MGSHEVDLIGCCFAQSRFYKLDIRNGRNRQTKIQWILSTLIVHQVLSIMMKKFYSLFQTPRVLWSMSCCYPGLVQFSTIL